MEDDDLFAGLLNDGFTIEGEEEFGNEDEYFDYAFYGSDEAAIEREIDEMEMRYGL